MASPAEGAPEMPIAGDQDGQGALAGMEAMVGGGRSRGPSGGAKRLSFVLNEDGLLDVTGAREETRATLRRVFSDPGLAGKLGVEVPLDLAGGFGPQDTAMLFAALGQIQVVVAAKALKYPPEVARVFAFTDDEARALAGPGARVLNRYMSPALLQHKDLVSLVMMFSVMIQGKLVAARMLHEQHKRGGVVSEVKAEAAASVQ